MGTGFVGVSTMFETDILHLDTTVADLIDGDLRTWKTELISDSFSDTNAAAILKILLSRFALHDTLIWHFDSKGFHTIKSGYKLLCNMEDELDDEASDFDEDDDLTLRLLWKADVPPKILMEVLS